MTGYATFPFRSDERHSACRYHSAGLRQTNRAGSVARGAGFCQSVPSRQINGRKPENQEKDILVFEQSFSDQLR